MAKKKAYAVRKGLAPGVYGTWDECKAQVDGFPGAEYKGFPTEAEAKAWLAGGDCPQAPGTDPGDCPPVPGSQACLEAYVDGSFDGKSYGYGAVIMDGGRVLELKGKGSDPGMAAMRNVAGEIMGAARAIRFALENGYPAITVHHDYQGIASWPDGEWAANKPGTRAYADYVAEARKKIRVTFRKVKGHSGDRYNDMADGLARSALGL